MRAWRSLPALYPPKNWSGPVPPGYQVPQGANQGMRSCKECPWVPVRVIYDVCVLKHPNSSSFEYMQAGKNDGTKFTEVQSTI